MTPSRSRAAAVVVACLFVSGCAGEECQNGADVVREVGASLVVEAVLGPDGTTVPVVELSHLRLDGRPVDRRALVSSPYSAGLALARGRVVCTLPCGLPGPAGLWQLRVTGPDASSADVDAAGAPMTSANTCQPPRGRVPRVVPRLAGPGTRA